MCGLNTHPESTVRTALRESHSACSPDQVGSQVEESVGFGGVGTDAKSHNVLGTTSSGDEIDTPSLIRVRMSGPYFHDGRYRSLDDVLADKTSKMGKTSSLSSDDQAAMRAYLESL